MLMNETTFRIRPYSKRELARLYFPETVHADSAVANLRNQIRRIPNLVRDLAEFTPKQVGILVRYLGEP